MARTKTDPTVVRPRCPEHPANRVWLDGFRRCEWSDAHRRPRYRCVTPEGTKGHAFSLPVAVRQPTERHPDSGAGVPDLRARVWPPRGRPDGPRLRVRPSGDRPPAAAGRRGHEPARASPDLRDSVFRSPGGVTSRQANLAVDYLDAFAPAVVAALHPTALAAHPRARLADPLHPGLSGGPGPGPDGVPDEAWVGELRRARSWSPSTARPAPAALPDARRRCQGHRELEDVPRHAQGGPRWSWPISMRPSRGPCGRPGRRDPGPLAPPPRGAHA